VTVSTRLVYRQAPGRHHRRCLPAEAARRGRASGGNPPSPTREPADVARSSSPQLSLSVSDISLASLVWLRPTVARISGDFGVSAAERRSRAANTVASIQPWCPARSQRAFRCSIPRETFSSPIPIASQRLNSTLDLSSRRQRRRDGVPRMPIEGYAESSIHPDSRSAAFKRARPGAGRKELSLS
jgi:hypothetical protein